MSKPMNKSQIYQALSESSDLTKKQVAAFFDSLSKLIQKELGKKGPGVLAIPGLLKLKRITKPATKETTQIDLGELRKTSDKFLQEVDSFLGGARPFAFRNLHMVAFVQDDDTKEVLAAIEVPVK